MRPLALSLAAACLVAHLGAASVGLSGPGGVSRVVQVQADRVGGLDPVGLSIETQYRASYYYCLAQLAELMGQSGDAAQALERAQAADPSSKLLRRERAEQLEASGDDSEAVVLWQAELEAAPQDLDLRRRLSRLYLRLGRVGEARSLFLNRDGSDPQDPAWLRSLVAMDLVQDDLSGAQGRLETLLAKTGDKDDRELLALTLQKRQRWAEAVQQFQQVVKEDPARGQAWARLSACHEAAGDTASAKADLRQGMAAAPDNGLLQESLAKLCYRTGDFAEAEAGFGKLLQQDPKDASDLLFRGMARLKGKRYAEAESDFKALGELKQGDPSQGYALALSQILQKKYAPAEAQLKRVLAEDPGAEPAWVQMALLYDRQGRSGDARAMLEKGLKANPKSQDLALMLSGSYEQAADYKGAAAVLRSAIKRGGGPVLRFQLAVMLDKQGDFAKAEGELVSLIADEPRDAQALNYLGYSWTEKGVKLAQAEGLIRRALDVEPDNHYYLDSLGWSLHRQAHDQQALEPLQRASAGLEDSRDPDEAVVFDHLAEVAKDLGDAVQAEKAQDQARRIRERAKEKPDAAIDRLEKESGL